MNYIYGKNNMKMIKKLYFSEIDSTNEYAEKNLAEMEDRTVIYAGIQTKGRGRGGRSWYSSEGNLFASLILKPQADFCDICRLSAIIHYAAVILARVFKKNFKLDTNIKWPNDILADGKKIAGILIETVIKGECLQGVIIGVGVNLNMSKEDFRMINQPATSLNIVSGMKINRDRFLDYFLDEFFLQYEDFLSKGFSLIKNDYKRLSMVLGKEVKVIVSGKEYCGIAKDIDDYGQLVLDCYNKTEIINAGEIIC